jgi:hypothetical protein
MGKRKDTDGGGEGKLVVFPGGKGKSAPADDGAPWELRRDLDAAVKALADTGPDDADALNRLDAEVVAARQTIYLGAKLGAGVDPRHVQQLQKLEVMSENRRLLEEANALTRRPDPPEAA